jgi:hypothetical protein
MAVAARPVPNVGGSGASLHHSNIATIYGLEHCDGIRFLVLELVEGPTPGGHAVFAGLDRLRSGEPAQEMRRDRNQSVFFEPEVFATGTCHRYARKREFRHSRTD